MLLYDEECLRRVVPMQEVQQIAHYKAQDDINKLLNGTDTEFRAMQRTVGFSRKDMEKRKEQKKNQIYSSYKEAQSYMKIAEVRSTRCAVASESVARMQSNHMCITKSVDARCALQRLHLT